MYVLFCLCVFLCSKNQINPGESGKYKKSTIVDLRVHCFFFFFSVLLFSFPTPDLQGRSNLTSLDIQIKKLRDNALSTIRDGARRMREEAREISDTLTDLESWADKLKTLAEEVQSTDQTHNIYGNLYPNQWTTCLLLLNTPSIHNSAFVHMFLLSLCLASEQHTWRDHLDAAGREKGGLQSHPCSPNPLLHIQWAGLWTALWQDTDSLFTGTHK